MSDNIKVVVKVRPLISREIEDKLSYQWRVKNNTLYQIDQNGKDLGQTFTFDRVYDDDTKTSDVYNEIAKPIVQAATAGFNGTIFAYGQTSSGKTYTMTGTDSSPGIIQLAVVNLFEIIRNVPDRDFLVRVSYIEIYNETVKDLLNIDKGEKIKVHETYEGIIKVNATERVTSTPEEVLEAMKEGEANRQKGATNMNEQSSRSHSIFQIIIESREHTESEEEPGCVNVSQLNLVDLAGSERSGQIGATGMRFKESTHINKSLSALALVIKQLAEDSTKFVNYRDNILTRILQNSLGGNAKTSIICAVTPAAVEETISTLQFANRAKSIKNKPEVNAVAKVDSTMIQRLTKQMCKLQAQLESKKNIEEDNYKLQSKIANLQKLIVNGFAQRRSVDLVSGTRRKLQQPRRITISTLHSIPDDEPVVSIPKFCTPSLKYNPNAVQRPDFAPIHDTKLAAVPEEPAQRLTTPPPTKTVFFSDEVIELDSDDDDSTRDDAETCSPIHKCYGATKTPPCVLRRHAKEAERNLKGILELTEREKLYSPNVVEYIEKLEHNSSVIANLQDQIEVMTKQSKEKDLQMDHLKSKIKKTEEDLKSLTSAKNDLWSQCENYNIRLTDAEISYETLRNKAKLREEELLSLLEEITVSKKKPEDIGKVLSRTLDKEMHFMDISKDISLVNSDSDSLTITNDDESDNVNELIDTQSNSRETITSLEANIFAQQQKISSLENANSKLQEEAATLKDKLVFMNNETDLLKSNIETLNSTIKAQQENLTAAKNDIDSYNSLIQELQIKLSQKESLPTVHIDDSALEKMIANEEKFIANNENMKNIIHSLKIALESRNKEIDKLKTSVQINSEVTLENVNLLNQLESKTQELDYLKKQINENVTSVQKLMNENKILKVIEHDLSEKLATFKHKTSELEKLNREISIVDKSLREENYKLTLSMADKNVVEKELADINKTLLKQIEDMTDKLAQLETDIAEKDDLISSLKKEDKESKEYLLCAKAAVLKSQLILGTLSGSMQDVPEIIENFVNVFSVLSASMNTLENVANDVVKQKEEAFKNNADLKLILEEITSKHSSEISALQEQLKSLSSTKCNSSEENSILTQTVSQLNEELKAISNELHSKTIENESLESNLNQAAENIYTCNKKIADLSEEKLRLDRTLLDMKEVLENVTSKLDEKENMLQEKISEIIVIQEEISNSNQERDELLQNICKKITEFTISFNIQNDTRGDVGTDCKKIHERILLTLDKIGSHIKSLSSKSDDDESNKLREIILEGKKEIVELTQQNLSLVEQLSQIESKRNELTSELKRIQNDNTELNEELSMGQGILQSLQVELKSKSEELTTMENKVRTWKDEFSHLESIMKQQRDELKLENEKLKTLIPGNQAELKSIITYEHRDSYNINNQNKTSVSDIKACGDVSSPPSLMTICSRLINVIELQVVDSKTTTISSNDEHSVNSGETYIIKCKCKQLTSELDDVRDENSKMIDLLQEMEAINQQLIQEQHEVRSEIQLLVAPAQELQKKIITHKTNLSILLATTIAENRALKSQVKVLQHHHSRFHNVCQRDIPGFKKQLSELMTLLKGNSSIVDQQNASFKRYSLPDILDSSTALPSFKNESTLDGDLLMLDTNITMTTVADNTLTGHDQTCLDITHFYKEASCQTNELNQITEQNIQDMEILSHDNQAIYERLNMLKDENAKLRQLVSKYEVAKQSMRDAQISPMKISNSGNENTNNTMNNDEIKVLYECAKCKNQSEIQHVHEQLHDDLKSLTAELLTVKAQKTEIEQKYSNLMLETPSTDLLLRKLNNLEKDLSVKIHEINKLSSALNSKIEELKDLQDENDQLSTQVIESISEADDLNKELNRMKIMNTQLLDKCSELEQSVKDCSCKQRLSVAITCSECLSKDELIKALQARLENSHTKLNRSLSDSDTSSRYNKICTLQNELHAGREDCKEITEDVVTIKNHLERSNLSMDLDDSMGEPNTFTKDFAISSPQSQKCSMPDIPEEHLPDMYIVEKEDCLNYYVEKTGIGKDNINQDIKIIDLMKTFYEHLLIKHGNEVENLTNKLKDYNESKSQLEIQISNLKLSHSKVTTELEQKDQNYSTIVNAIMQIKNNIHSLNEKILKVTDTDITKLINMYKENFFKVLDNELGLSSMKIIETLIDNIVSKHKTELTAVMERYSTLQAHMESVTSELNSVNENLAHMKTQLSDKESEYNLLKKQKERIHEISNAVTLDLVKKDRELTEAINNGYKKLIELHIISDQHVDLTLPSSVHIDLLFEQLIKQYKNNLVETEKDNLVLEIKKSKQLIEEKEKEIEALQMKSQHLQEINNTVTINLVDIDNKLQTQYALHEGLNTLYESKVEENKVNIDLTQKLLQEVQLLKNSVNDKEKIIDKFELQINTQNQGNSKEMAELIGTIKVLQDDLTNLKSINELIVKEKDSYALELLKSGETLKQNNTEMDKMTSDILILKESVRENVIVIDNLNVEVKNLLKQNMELKEKLEDKCRECFRLETNIKTHEKTAEIQSRMIMRLEKQKYDDDKTISEKTKEAEDLKYKCTALQKQCDTRHNDVQDEIDVLRKKKEALEVRVSELETQLENKSRPSIDALAESSRQRRQSLHDSKRIFAEDKHEFGDQNNVEAMFDSRPKPDDLFADVDEDISNRSSPIMMRLSKGRESMSLSRTDQSDRDEEHPSRPSSVVATRRRRQSIHDLHRSVQRHSPSPHGFDVSNRIIDELNHSKPSDTSGGHVSELVELRSRLSACQQELEDLKQKYRELDEECDTCALYLRERDQHCARLKKEKLALQTTIAELKEKLQSCNPNQSQQTTSKPSVAHVGVNTDEDWTNLHSVVVDRMSYDAEVEKNKRLTKTIEELRFKKQDLKNTLAKMQSALEKNSNHRELESSRAELQACKQELVQLRQKYKELDDECETCAQYLRDQEEQCRKLKKAKIALEEKLQEYQGDFNLKTRTARKKRQNIHDESRSCSVDVNDASTETCDDFLSYLVERDGSSRVMSDEVQAKEVKRLKMVVEKLSQQKAMLEQQLLSVSALHPQPAMYVATGSAIVQNQQLTDVMKENQKLKKLNAKLVNICKKRGKESNRENEDPADQG